MGKKIMLVDDAAFMRMMIKDTLQKNGYTEIVATASRLSQLTRLKSRIWF